MPARKGFPYKELYWEIKDLIGKGKYAFVRKHHVYFGKQKEISLFGQPVYAYIYVDQYHALKRFRDFLVILAELNKQVKDYYKLFKTDVPAHVKMDVFKAELMKSKM